MWEIFLKGHVLSTGGDALMPLEPLPHLESHGVLNSAKHIWSLGKPAKTSLMAINLGQSATRDLVPGLLGTGNCVRTQRVPFNSKVPMSGRVSSNDQLGLTNRFGLENHAIGMAILPYRCLRYKVRHSRTFSRLFLCIWKHLLSQKIHSLVKEPSFC
jgi:hypothetical protein